MKNLLLLLIFGALTAPVMAQDLVPKTFLIKDLKTNGDACPQGSTTLNISEDKEAFTLNFSQFYVQKGPGAEPGDKRRFCRAVFDTEQDANWEYAVLAVNVRGFVQLDDKVTATQELQFGTRGIEYTAQKQFLGPIVEDYVYGEHIAIGNGRWSGCRPKAAERVKDFVVKSTADIRGGGKNATGLMTVDSIDGGLVQSYELVWRQCGDTKAKFLATCQVAGNNGRSVFVKGMGRDEARAYQKAYQHLQQRCEKVGPNFGSCDQAVAQCSVIKF
jgi:hypothetical protein